MAQRLWTDLCPAVRPAALAEAARWDDLEKLLTDWTFLEAKTAEGMLFDLARDFTTALEALPAGSRLRPLLDPLRKAILANVYFLAKHPALLFQCLWNRCWWYDCSEAAKHYEAVESLSRKPPPWEQPGPKLAALLESWRAAKERMNGGFRWLRCLGPPPFHLGMAQGMVIRGHHGPVLCAAFSPDGQCIASGTGRRFSSRLEEPDYSIRIWEATSGTRLACLRGHQSPVTCLAFFPDGERLLSGSTLCTVRVWNARRGTELASLCRTPYSVTGLAVSPDGLRVATAAFSGGVPGKNQGAVQVWDAQSGAELARMAGHDREVFGVAFSPDGRRVVSAAIDNTVRIWDAATGDGVGLPSRTHRLGDVRGILTRRPPCRLGLQKTTR